MHAFDRRLLQHAMGGAVAAMEALGGINLPNRGAGGTVAGHGSCQRAQARHRGQARAVAQKLAAADWTLDWRRGFHCFISSEISQLFRFMTRTLLVTKSTMYTPPCESAATSKPPFMQSLRSEQALAFSGKRLHPGDHGLEFTPRRIDLHPRQPLLSRDDAAVRQHRYRDRVAAAAETINGDRRLAPGSFKFAVERVSLDLVPANIIDS